MGAELALESGVRRTEDRYLFGWRQAPSSAQLYGCPKSLSSQLASYLACLWISKERLSQFAIRFIA